MSFEKGFKHAEKVANNNKNNEKARLDFQKWKEQAKKRGRTDLLRKRGVAKQETVNNLRKTAPKAISSYDINKNITILLTAKEGQNVSAPIKTLSASAFFKCMNPVQKKLYKQAIARLNDINGWGKRTQKPDANGVIRTTHIVDIADSACSTKEGCTPGKVTKVTTTIEERQEIKELVPEQGSVTQPVKPKEHSIHNLGLDDNEDNGWGDGTEAGAGGWGDGTEAGANTK